MSFSSTDYYDANDSCALQADDLRIQLRQLQGSSKMAAASASNNAIMQHNYKCVAPC